MCATRINEPRSSWLFQRIRHPVLPERLSDVAAMFNKVNKISRRCCVAGMLLTARACGMYVCVCSRREGESRISSSTNGIMTLHRVAWQGRGIRTRGKGAGEEIV